MSIESALDKVSSRRLMKDMAAAIPPIQRRVSKGDQTSHGQNGRSLAAELPSIPANATVERWPLPGLAPMTRVRTSFGDVHSIALRKGDEVLTRGGEYLPILWINRIKLDEHILTTKPDSNPIVIGARALGSHGELLVSPRQVIHGDASSDLAEPREAASLVTQPGVRRLRETGLTYTMFHVGCAAEIYCEGLYLDFPLEA